MKDMTRRDFVKRTAMTAGVGAVLVGTSKTSWAGANDRVRVAQLGIRGQGKSHIRGYNDLEGVEVATICDVDETLFEPRMKEFFDDKGIKRPNTETDLRRVMDDDSIDVVSIAIPHHWHSLAAIWACQAGKDVYVEKPCSHNIFEGRQLVEAANKYGRVVQHGTQIRSSEGIQEAIRKLREGVIGDVYMARGLCYRWRGSIGKGQAVDPPATLNWDLWQGPAQERQYRDYVPKNGDYGVYVHYNWHWCWDYGNGDIGNQGVHQMDVARWGLGVDLPSKVTSMSGMYLFDDDKEVPNVITSAFDYPDAGERGKLLVFDTRPWCTNSEKGAKVGVLFYGSEGYMVIDSYSHYKVYLGRKEEPGPERDAGGDHKGNFIAAVRAQDPSLLNAPIEEGHKSSALCHLGLISARLGRSLEFDPQKERFINDRKANKLLTRDYRKPFVVPKKV